MKQIRLLTSVVGRPVAIPVSTVRAAHHTKSRKQLFRHGQGSGGVGRHAPIKTFSLRDIRTNHRWGHSMALATCFSPTMSAYASLVNTAAVKRLPEEMRRVEDKQCG
jgi:hypothetical protein